MIGVWRGIGRNRLVRPAICRQGLHRPQRIRSRPSFGFSVPDRSSFTNQISGTPWEGLAPENLLPEQCEHLMVWHIRRGLFAGASLVLGQFLVNGAAWQYSCRLTPLRTAMAFNRRWMAEFKSKISLVFCASMASPVHCQSFQMPTDLVHSVEVVRIGVGLSAAQHSPERSPYGNSREASPSRRLGRGWECSIRGVPQRGL